jgi:hypothetical protein
MTAGPRQRSVLVIGVSQRILDDIVVALRDLGYTAQATTDFRIHELTGMSGLVYEEAPGAAPMAGDVLAAAHGHGPEAGREATPRLGTAGAGNASMPGACVLHLPRSPTGSAGSSW